MVANFCDANLAAALDGRKVKGEDTQRQLVRGWTVPGQLAAGYLDGAETLILAVKSAQEENRAWQKSHEEEERAWKNDHETRLRTLEKSSTEILTRMTMGNLVQGIFTAIASTAAAFIGRTP